MTRLNAAPVRKQPSQATKRLRFQFINVGAGVMTSCYTFTAVDNTTGLGTLSPVGINSGTQYAPKGQQKDNRGNFTGRFLRGYSQLPRRRRPARQASAVQ